MVEFLFSDDGPGVPENSLDRIFESFYRVDVARSNAGKGSGIGLAVVKEIITGHKGIVYAKKREGLAIIIHLPLIYGFEYCAFYFAGDRHFCVLFAAYIMLQRHLKGTDRDK